MICEHRGSDPELIESDGTFRLRYRPCPTCGAGGDVALPETVDAVVRDVLAKLPPGPHRELELDLVAILGPYVAQTFPDCWSRIERWNASHLPDLAAISAGDDSRIVDWLRGSSGYGQARCIRNDGQRALATFTLRQTQDQRMKLQLATRGVAPLLAIDSRPDGGAVMFEALPAGIPLSSPMLPLSADAALTLFAQLIAIASAAADAGQALRGLRPELVYLGRGVRISGVAPRAEPFAREMIERDVSPEFPFDATYTAPEIIRDESSSSAADVFSSCAILLFLMSRRPPYGGGKRGLLEQLAAMLEGPPEIATTLDPAIAHLVRAGLDPIPTNRPRAAELGDTLAPLGYLATPPLFVAA